MQNDYLVLVNPNAGGKKAAKDWPLIEGFLQQAELNYQVFFTKYRHHAIQLTKEYLEKGFTKIIAVGGDGTINEVVNGIFLSNSENIKIAELGVVMIGTGNDWGRMFDIPSDYEKAIEIIKNRNIFRQDVGHATFHTGNKLNERFFINAAGIGFDAMVCNKTNERKDKGHSSNLSYLRALLTSLLKYRSLEANLRIDQRDLISTKLFTMSVGIGKFSGGGMQQVPDALADDGLFDITLVNKISKAKIVRKIKKLYDGTIKEIEEIDAYRAKKVEVSSSEKMLLEVDGEILGHAPFTFEIIDDTLGICVP